MQSLRILIIIEQSRRALPQYYFRVATVARRWTKQTELLEGHALASVATTLEMNFIKALAWTI